MFWRARGEIQRHKQVVVLPVLRRRKAVKIDFGGIDAPQGVLDVIGQLQAFDMAGRYVQKVDFLRVTGAVVGNDDKPTR